MLDPSLTATDLCNKHIAVWIICRQGKVATASSKIVLRFFTANSTILTKLTCVHVLTNAYLNFPISSQVTLTPIDSITARVNTKIRNNSRVGTSMNNVQFKLKECIITQCSIDYTCTIYTLLLKQIPYMHLLDHIMPAVFGCIHILLWYQLPATCWG